MSVAGIPTDAQQANSDTVMKSGFDRGLSGKQRVSKSEVFREAFDKGTKHVGKYMVMWLRAGDDACLRVGVVASKRSLGRAVDRARAKRLLREAYRLNRFRFSGKFDVILVARARIIETKRQAVDEDLLSLASKAGLLKGKP